MSDNMGFPGKPIKAICTSSKDEVRRQEVVDRERDLIKVVGVCGQMGHVPWFEVSRDGQIIGLVNAAHVQYVEFFND